MLSAEPADLTALAGSATSPHTKLRDLREFIQAWAEGAWTHIQVTTATEIVTELRRNV